MGTAIRRAVTGTPRSVVRKASVIVAASAIAMPVMPAMFPALAVSCLESPARAAMKSTAAMMYAA